MTDQIETGKGEGNNSRTVRRKKGKKYIKKTLPNLTYPNLTNLT